MKFPRKYQYCSYRQWQIALREWRVWNRQRIKELHYEVRV